MAKWANAEMNDQALNYLKNNAVRLMIGTAQPATYANGNTYAVGTLSTTSTNFTVAGGDGAGNSRKITHSAATITVGTSGTINHIYFMGTAGSGTLIFVGTCAPTSVTAAGTVVLAAWDIDEIADPT